MPTILVIPCYNEAQRFPAPRFVSYLDRNPDISLVLVSDGSTDDTVGVLRQVQTAWPSRVHIIDRKINLGKAETVREGIVYALNLVDKPSIVGFWDADLATPLEAVAELLQVLELSPGVQMVIGARVNLLGRKIRRQPLRHYLGRLFATVVSALVLRLPVYDTQCGAKLFRVSPEMRKVFTEPFSSRWVFDVEILARWIRLHNHDRSRIEGTIFEYPLYAWQDVGSSKVKPFDFVKALRDIARIYFRYR